jgi:hypothetical protein
MKSQLATIVALAFVLAIQPCRAQAPNAIKPVFDSEDSRIKGFRGQLEKLGVKVEPDANAKSGVWRARKPRD